jgi:hypothetical protein
MAPLTSLKPRSASSGGVVRVDSSIHRAGPGDGDDSGKREVNDERIVEERAALVSERQAELATVLEKHDVLVCGSLYPTGYICLTRRPCTGSRSIPPRKFRHNDIFRSGG